MSAMKQVNLIPAARRLRKRRARTLRAGALFCAAYSLLATAAGAAAWMTLHETDDQLIARTEQVAQSIKCSQARLTRIRAQSAAARSQLQANSRLTQRPDWSLLMGLISDAGADQVMLRRVAVRRADPPPAPIEIKKPGAKPRPAGESGPVAPSEFAVELSGFARTSLETSEFAMRLEKLGLFEKVTLLETSREPYQGEQATRFSVRCTLVDSSGATVAHIGGRP